MKSSRNSSAKLKRFWKTELNKTYKASFSGNYVPIWNDGVQLQIAHSNFSKNTKWQE